MKRTILFLLLGTVFLLSAAGCGPREYTPYALADFCDTVEGGKYATISGVLKIPDTIMEYDRSYGLLLVEDINQAQPSVRIGIPIGKKNNQMQTLTDDFTLEDIKIQTNDGQTVTHGDAISVSGFVGGSCGAGNSDIKVALIESK
ncbi:MAG: hypothetical protein GY803_20990 [Chloroflexi bacterium]|nr:hypothetical protein [Chloroflexota bacterium]